MPDKIQIMKGVIFSFLLLIFSLVIPVLTFAQISNPGCDPLCNCYPDGTPCPIDGGLTILIVAGIGYGIKRIKSAPKENL